MVKYILIGGTGTVGNIYAEYFKHQNITVFSRNEHKQWEMRQKYPHFNYILGDIRDKQAVSNAIKGKTVVIHFAAMKHVSTCENQPDEAMKTNVIGTQNVVDACIEHNVEKAIYFNTDKSIKPINTYGATKYLASQIWENANKILPVFNTIISGNVINSSGSVIPIFMNKIKNGETTLTLTHENVERYWVKPLEICKTFLDIFYSKNPDTFIPKMVSFKIIDLILALDCKWKITGLTKGEKIIEDMPEGYECETIGISKIKELLEELNVE